jgi:peroxiredoxin Q/BCP
MTTLKVGDKAPAFSLKTDTEDTVKLADFKNEKNIVLYFYPKDSTPGCTKQACAFSEHLKKFEKLDAVIIGVSPDTVQSHTKFRSKYNLTIILGADESKAVCEKYGVWTEKSMYGKKFMGVVRTTFIIDKAGKIAAIWPNVKVVGHDEEVLKTLKEISI